MRDQLPALLIVIPLTVSLLAPLFAYISRELVKWTTTLGILLSNLAGIGVLLRVIEEGPWHYRFGNWEPPWGIEYVLDNLNISIAILISFISFFVAVYSRGYLAGESWMKTGVFYALYGLVTTGLLGMVITGDVFNLYVFLEVSSLSAYALIAMGGHRGTVAALKYLLIGTIGASFYLLGVGYLYAVTGTLNMADMADKLVPLMHTPPVLLAATMIFVGMGIKMGLFPMHFWLPDSYTYAYSPAIAFISGTMTKVQAYVLFRFFYYIFDANSIYIGELLNVAGVLAGIGIIAGSIMAIAQKDFRRMLAYSSVAQIGYIIVGFAIGNTYALIGAVFHILNHALMKSSLFLIAGGIKYKFDEVKIENFGEMSKKMPVSMYCYLICAFSMVGIPPTAGFFSKWYLVVGAAQEGMWIYIAIIIVSSILNAVYFFRIIEFAYLKKAVVDLKDKFKGRIELPLAMIIPILVLSLSVLMLGIFNDTVVSDVLIEAVMGVAK